MHTRRSMSNQFEMMYQARMKKFVRENHPCYGECLDRCGTCKLGCEKLKEYEAKRNAFIKETRKYINGQRRVEDSISLAKRKNTERT